MGATVFGLRLTQPGFQHRGHAAEPELSWRTFELNDVHPFHYLTELLRHAQELKHKPSEWMPWNYRETLASRATPTAA
jgi:hypothetical protein